MKNTLTLVAVALVSTLALVGCGKSKCEEAADIIKDCTGQGGDSSSSSDSDAKCEGAAEKAAQCIIDNESGACDALKGNITSDGAKNYLKCATGQ